MRQIEEMGRCRSDARTRGAEPQAQNGRAGPASRYASAGEDRGGNAWAALVCATLLAAGCASPFKSKPEAAPPGSPAPGAGRYYLDDGPGERPIAELETLADAVPRTESLHRFANRPYVVFGRSYQPMTRLEPFRERGTATWYGRRYHDRPTATGERYDMYAMTAAHTRLPLPSYARVTHLGNGRSVIVRVNDRGPFLHGRVIDLSYAAAARLGFARSGTAEVEVELITDPEILAGGSGRAAEASGPSSQPPVAGAPPVILLPDAKPESVSFPAPQAEPVPINVPLPPARPVRATVSDPQPASANALPQAPLPLEAGSQIVQIGAYTSRDNAEAAQRALQARLGSPGLALAVRQDGKVFRLLAGPFQDAGQARAAAGRIRAMTGIEAFARRL